MGPGFLGLLPASSDPCCHPVWGEGNSPVFVLVLPLKTGGERALTAKSDGAEFLWSAGGTVEPRTLLSPAAVCGGQKCSEPFPRPVLGYWLHGLDP